ncbi:MAG: hypothetical protein K6E19_07410 [Lachnospiraceae bacterium]|nr:hypothetical protein [Lachnospiraceae bacterium]
MKLYDYDDTGKSKTLAGILCITAIVAVVVIVVFVNRDSFRKQSTDSSFSAKISEIKERAESSVSFSIDDTSHLTVSDLDFYDMYKESDNKDGAENTESTASVSTSGEVSEEATDESTDGKHTLVRYDDGTEEWVAISQYYPKHEYDFTNLVNQSGKMKYFEGDKCVSTYGVEITKDQGYVDFNKVKKSGAGFVMLRVGARGYQTGQITLDDYFADNLKRASDAGLDIGVYFLSQAVTEEEAIEEANTVIEALGEYKLRFPIAYVMQYAKGDTARVEGVSKKDKTTIARAFLNTVKEKGFIPMIYGTKAWLIKNVDLTLLVKEYDTWLSQPEYDMPDYPYRFTMWRYTTEGSVDGIVGSVNMDICFVDYTLK